MGKQKSGTEVDSMAVRPSELKQLILKCIESEVPLLIAGSPGIGKSAIVYQAAKTLGREFIDIRLAYMDPVDLHGLPIVTDGKMSFARPSILPDNPHSEGVILFDEIKSVSQMLQVAAYQLILEGRVGEHRIEGNWARIGAGNLDSDGAITYEMSSALANRFVHCTLVPDADDWTQWAISAGVAPEVVGYLKMFPNSLSEAPGYKPAFCSPRSWNRVSDLVLSPMQLSRTLELKMFAGAIGDGEAGKFCNHLHKFRELPHPDSIIAKPGSSPVPADPAAQYTLSLALAYKASRANIVAIIKYLKRLGPEMQVLASTTIVQRSMAGCDVTAIASPEWNEYVAKIQQDYIA